MSVWPSDYVEYVLDDIKKYNDVRKPVKANPIERLFVTKAAPGKLHPNPDDEFSMEHIGPHMGIVGDYVKEAQRLDALNLQVFPEAIVVEKMEPDGYLLINGHHRWFAARRFGIDSVKIKIVNLVHSDDLHRMLESTTNTKRVAFDFDEVLLATEGAAEEVRQKEVPENFGPERLRAGVAAVVDLFHKQGYDVWVYTSGYLAEEDIRGVFDLYHLEIDGVVNGLNEKISKETKEARESIDMKYTQTIHIDNESVLVTKSEEKDYDQYDIAPGEKWADSIIEVINQVEG